MAVFCGPQPISRQYIALINCRNAVKDVLESSLSHPLFLRLAWSDAATYDTSISLKNWPHCGGVNGSVISEYELSLPGNAGLSKAVALLQDVKLKYSTVSWADIIQMAGALAVELTGGPVIDMIYGRLDAGSEYSSKVVCYLFVFMIMILVIPQFASLPTFQHPYPEGAQTAESHIRNIFYRMGFTNKEIVALCGAHTIGAT